MDTLLKTLPLAVAHTLGNVLTNVSLGLVGVPLGCEYKCGEEVNINEGMKCRVFLWVRSSKY